MIQKIKIFSLKNLHFFFLLETVNTNVLHPKFLIQKLYIFF